MLSINQLIAIINAMQAATGCSEYEITTVLRATQTTLAQASIDRAINQALRFAIADDDRAPQAVAASHHIKRS
jgi:siderophore synthetase component